MAFLGHLRRRLAQHTQAGLMRTPRLVGGAQGPEIVIGGHRVVCLCSNNYLGLASDPRLVARTRDALAEAGAGAGASRHISGTMQFHVQAEQALARFVRLPRSLLFATGYAANLGAVQALADEETIVFSDARNHASLIDGCRLSRARVHVYQHSQLDHLESLLVSHRAEAPAALVLTESVFSMDGDRAPLRELRALCDRYDAGLLVDEAHALGTLGPEGRGLCADEGITPDALVGTLGKAFGLAGAFVAGDDDLVRLIENNARSYIFSTAPSPAVAAAAAFACDLVARADDRRASLAAAGHRLRLALRELGYDAPDGVPHVIPVLIGAADQTMRLSAKLLEHGVFVHGIRPPTVPAGTSRLRVTPMATHTPAHLDRALDAFRMCRT